MGTFKMCALFFSNACERILHVLDYCKLRGNSILIEASITKRTITCCNAIYDKKAIPKGSFSVKDSALHLHSMVVIPEDRHFLIFDILNSFQLLEYSIDLHRFVSFSHQLTFPL